MSVIGGKEVRRLAGFEVNALVKGGLVPIEDLKGARVAETGTPIHDIDGSILFYRVPIVRRGKLTLYADLAANTILGSTLLAFHLKMPWVPEEFVKQAGAAARKRMRDFAYDRATFVAFSYPKIAVQFMKADKEVAMVELHTWELVPPLEERPKEPYHSRWSLVKAVPADLKEKRIKLFKERMDNWEKMVTPRINVEYIDPDVIKVPWPAVQHEELVIHYSPDLATHSPCYELIGQHTGVWCVAASTKMILDFYRFVYSQDRIAAEEGLGTHAYPNGLPYGEEHKVVDTIEKLSSNGLDATLNMSPNWAEFRSEIKANRPLISFIPGHSRTIAGYSQTKLFAWYLSRFLRLYDPWSPHVGAISWENFDAQTYRATFTIVPKTV